MSNTQARRTVVASALNALSGTLGHKRLSLLLLLLLGMGAAATLRLVGPPRRPEIHNEFANLLAADTFAHGRLTNPTHPLWRCFETFHVLHRPSYMSKVPPAEAVLQAVGQVLTGQPVVGVWLSAGLLAAAVGWMIRGWAPWRWAVFGALLTIGEVGIAHPWAQSYRGGAAAGIGAAMVWGALPRIMRTQRLKDALVLALGLAVLANSRPFEGLVVSLPAAAALAWWWLGSSSAVRGVALRRVFLPVALSLALLVALMAHYNAVVTCDPLLLPQQAWDRQYTNAPTFLWQQPRPMPDLSHQVFKDHVAWQMARYEALRGQRGFHIKAHGLKDVWRSIFYPATWLVVALSPWLLRQRPLLGPIAACALLLVAMFLVVPSRMDQIGPVAPLMALLVVASLRQTSLWRCPRQPIVTWILVAAVLSVTVHSAATNVQEHLRHVHRQRYWAAYREQLLHRLRREGGRHLVIVRYAPTHLFHYEWVYNDADIDNSPVVIARDPGPAHHRDLLEYFSDRRIHLVEVSHDFRAPAVTDLGLAYHAVLPTSPEGWRESP